jgi:DNA-binding transcriptional LysR family regulator
MKTFVAVVESGGFASAGRKLGMSAAGVTRAVAELEEHLGLRLLIRTTRMLRVTDEGARYGADCKRILADIEEAEQAAVGSHGKARGSLTVTASVMFGQRYVTPVLVDYLQRYPDVDVQCLFMDRIVNLLEEGVDVAVRIGELPDSSLSARRLGQVRRVLVASPTYLARRGQIEHPDALAGHTIVSATGMDATVEWRFQHDGEQIVRRIHPTMRTTTNESAITAAENGLGITRLLSYQVAPALAAGRLQLVLPGWEPAPLPVHVLHQQGLRVSQKVRALIDLLIEQVGNDPALH